MLGWTDGCTGGIALAVVHAWPGGSASQGAQLLGRLGRSPALPPLIRLFWVAPPLMFEETTDSSFLRQKRLLAYLRRHLHLNHNVVAMCRKQACA